MYWIAATCGTDADMKKAKWLSMVNHVSNKHDGHGELFPKCEHGPVVEQRKWIQSGKWLAWFKLKFGMYFAITIKNRLNVSRQNIVLKRHLIQNRKTNTIFLKTQDKTKYKNEAVKLLLSCLFFFL